MKFSKYVFWIAGVYGLVATLPLYFMLHLFNERIPPAVTHPEFYYGFIGLAVAWQLAYLLIGDDPVRFRPFMVLAVIAKFTYAGAAIALYLQGRLHRFSLPEGLIDAAFGFLFIVAFRLTRPAPVKPR